MPIWIGSPRVEQALLDGAAERRAVRIAVVAEIGVVGVRMGVEMDEADRPRPRDGAQGRQCRQMVAADAERDRAGCDHGRDPGLDPGEPVVQVDRD